MHLVERTYVPAPVDGTSTWQILGTNEDACEQPGFDTTQFSIVIGDTCYDVALSTDNPELLSKVEEYHAFNNTFLPRPIKSSPDVLSVIYATNNDIVTESGVVISMGDNPYVAAVTRDGRQVYASGKNSVGTLKSICFGAATSLACKGTDKVPLHASVGTYDGEKAFAVTGRGNWGKTTNMIGAKIADQEISVVTDDWSILDTENGKLVPIDMLVAVRPEAIPGIMSATRCTEVPKYLTEAQKDAGRLFSVFEIFGGDYNPQIELERVLFTDKRKINDASWNVYPPDGLATDWRLQDDAYHSPDIESAYKSRYAKLLPKLEIGTICTVLPNQLRPLQLASIIKFFRG